MMQEEQALQVARCTKIINPGTEDAKYVINIKQVRSQRSQLPSYQEG
jgi:26S proteasome regulatory subunit T1